MRPRFRRLGVETIRRSRSVFLGKPDKAPGGNLEAANAFRGPLGIGMRRRDGNGDVEMPQREARIAGKQALCLQPFSLTLVALGSFLAVEGTQPSTKAAATQLALPSLRRQHSHRLNRLLPGQNRSGQQYLQPSENNGSRLSPAIFFVSGLVGVQAVCNVYPFRRRVRSAPARTETRECTRRSPFACLVLMRPIWISWVAATAKSGSTPRRHRGAR
jgi:hypothetical protein